MKHFIIIFLLISLLLVTACTPASPPTPISTPSPTLSPRYPGPGEYPDTILSNELERRFLVHVPEGYDPGTARALVFNFHGAGASVEQQKLLTAMSLHADQVGYIVVYPQALGYPTYWDTTTPNSYDVLFIVELLEHLRAHLNIDHQRVYATGFSNGGSMAEWLACTQADLFAAVAPVAGAYTYESPCNPSRSVPMIAFHGTLDYIVPYWGGYDLFAAIPIWAEYWAKRNNCNPDPVTGYEREGVSAQFWGKCAGRADVALYTAKRLGHTWPGSMYGSAPQYLDATEVIWGFFESHPMTDQ